MPSRDAKEAESTYVAAHQHRENACAGCCLDARDGGLAYETDTPTGLTPLFQEQRVTVDILLGRIDIDKQRL
eukprot:COSAG01_NODE_454_length_16827_cov_61.424199_2_plen_72_part_00